MRSLKILPLFIVTCTLKIGLAVLAWYVQSMLILGSIIPLSLMILYIFIGYRYREPVVSDEKFADSCYYLGFIFTIVSIILCLADLPNIGSEIYIIAARFGAAMISTVLGLFVRVCLVSFRPTLEDAVRNMEDHSVEASRRLIDSYQRSMNWSIFAVKWQPQPKRQFWVSREKSKASLSKPRNGWMSFSSRCRQEIHRRWLRSFRM